MNIRAILDVFKSDYIDTKTNELEILLAEEPVKPYKLRKKLESLYTLYLANIPKNIDVIQYIVSPVMYMKQLNKYVEFLGLDEYSSNRGTLFTKLQELYKNYFGKIYRPKLDYYSFRNPRVAKYSSNEEIADAKSRLLGFFFDGSLTTCSGAIFLTYLLDVFAKPNLLIYTINVDIDKEGKTIHGPVCFVIFDTIRRTLHLNLVCSILRANDRSLSQWLIGYAFNDLGLFSKVAKNVCPYDQVELEATNVKLIRDYHLNYGFQLATKSKDVKTSEKLFTDLEGTPIDQIPDKIRIFLETGRHYDTYYVDTKGWRMVLKSNCFELARHSVKRSFTIPKTLDMPKELAFDESSQRVLLEELEFYNTEIGLASTSELNVLVNGCVQCRETGSFIERSGNPKIFCSTQCQIKYYC